MLMSIFEFTFCLYYMLVTEERCESARLVTEKGQKAKMYRALKVMEHNLLLPSVGIKQKSEEKFSFLGRKKAALIGLLRVWAARGRCDAQRHEPKNQGSPEVT